jgi:hypothetical protein
VEVWEQMVCTNLYQRTFPVIKVSLNEDIIAFPTERRQGLIASTALQAQPATAGAATAPPAVVTRPPAVHSQTEKTASIQDGRTLPVFPSSQTGQQRAVRKSAAQAKLWDILADKAMSSVNINQHIPPEKIVYMEQKKENLDKIIQTRLKMNFNP